MTEHKPLPCPFCGETGLSFTEGSTFRWLIAACNYCGASCGETRVQTLGEGKPEEWRAQAERNAVKEWNTRAPQESDQGTTSGPEAPK